MGVANLTHTNLKTETETLEKACQEQALMTNCMNVKIIKTWTYQKFRLYRLLSETIHNIVARCPTFAKKAYLDRHSTAAK